MTVSSTARLGGGRPVDFGADTGWLDELLLASPARAPPTRTHTHTHTHGLHCGGPFGGAKAPTQPALWRTKRLWRGKGSAVVLIGGRGTGIGSPVVLIGTSGRRRRTERPLIAGELFRTARRAPCLPRPRQQCGRRRRWCGPGRLKRSSCGRRPKPRWWQKTLGEWGCAYVCAIVLSDLGGV